MNKLFILILLCLLASHTNAQTNPTQAFGKVDVADLELKSCDFEKDANAEVLFDKKDVRFDDNFRILMDHHKRIKIFNNNGKGSADIHLMFTSRNNFERLTNIQAQTINLVNGKAEITKLDKALIYTKAIDKYESEITFTFPNVKEGSIIEYKYNWTTNSPGNFPDWYFQENIPVRYAELNTEVPSLYEYRTIPRIHSQPVVQTKSSAPRSIGSGADALRYDLETEKRAFANVVSIPGEAYMSSFIDNFEGFVFQLIAVQQYQGMGGGVNSESWARVGGILVDDESFGGQLKRKLDNEEAIIVKAKSLRTEDEKVAYIFNEVKNSMKWNGVDRWYTNDGTVKAWSTKIGNSAEINIILYHLLTQAGVAKVYPMVVSTRKHGKIIPLYTSLAQFDRTIVFVSGSTDRSYILDATSKFNTYNEIPAELLNSSGLFVDKQQKVFDIVFLKTEQPTMHSVYVTADLKPGGKIEGTASINSTGYDRINALSKYKTDGEKKYLDYLRDEDNNLKISSIKFENMEVDTLPLVQQVNFSLDLAGSDDNYIYLNPNILSSLKINPFVRENRLTNVDFGYQKVYSIVGVYKLPAGYKIESAPKNGAIIMPDETMVFKRSVVEQDGSVMVRYVINYKNAIYAKENYADFHGFHKKMNEMLNEQIILKKL
jgi:hypothetical protein